MFTYRATATKRYDFPLYRMVSNIGRAVFWVIGFKMAVGTARTAGGGAIYFRLSTGRRSGTWSSNQVLASSQNWNISAFFLWNFLNRANQCYTLFFERCCISLFSTRQSADGNLSESLCGQRNNILQKTDFSPKIVSFSWISNVEHRTTIQEHQLNIISKRSKECSHLGYYKDKYAYNLHQWTFSVWFTI